MVTPPKQQILELAKEKWRLDQIRFGNPKLAEIEPEYDELLESGYIAMARNELMYSERRKYAEWLESEDSELETVYEIPFDVDEALKTGFAILGNKGTGKTNLAKWLVKKLIDLLFSLPLQSHRICIFLLECKRSDAT